MNEYDHTGVHNNKNTQIPNLAFSEFYVLLTVHPL